MSGAVNMMIASGPSIVATDRSIADNALSPADAGAYYQARSDGAVWALRDSQADGELEKWLMPDSAAPASYQIRAHQESGDALSASSAALDTILALSTTRFWGVQETGNGIAQATLTIQYLLGGSVLKEIEVILTANVNL